MNNENTKLFDSEIKIMEVLWREGDVTAKYIAEVLAREVGWNKNTTYTLSLKDSLLCYTGTDVRSPLPMLSTLDYAGGLDHGLLELSDVLPSELYAIE